MHEKGGIFCCLVVPLSDGRYGCCKGATSLHRELPWGHLSGGSTLICGNAPIRRLDYRGGVQRWSTEVRMDMFKTCVLLTSLLLDDLSVISLRLGHDSGDRLPLIG